MVLFRLSALRIRVPAAKASTLVQVGRTSWTQQGTTRRFYASGGHEVPPKTSNLPWYGIPIFPPFASISPQKR
jgi:hypothetical protein